MNARKVMAVMCALLIVLSFSVQAYARWENTSSIITDLSFSGTTAECSVSIDGYVGTTKISATYKLQKKVGNTYTTVKTWTASGTKDYLDWSKTQTVDKGYTYRLYVTAKVTIGGSTETVNSYVTSTLKK